MQIGWIKLSARKNSPSKPLLWSTTDMFVEHFGFQDSSDLPYKDELKASGFLDKRAAIATLSDLAKNDELIDENSSESSEEEDNIADFIHNN
jgi:Predicted transcriptional regulator containing the HTH domain